MSEQIDIRISRDLFDQYVKEGILTSFSVLEVINEDVLSSFEYLDIKRQIAEEYQQFETQQKTHRQKTKELYKRLDELQHGKKTNE